MESSSPTAICDNAPGDPEKLRTPRSNSTAKDGAPNEADQETARSSRLRFWKKIEEGQKSDWWFASTGIPLLAATLGPLANISSIAALVTPWRMNVYIDGQFVAMLDGAPFPDPKWCYYFNVASLVCGFLGNVFLLFNFTQRIRYIIALPATIILWYLATGFLVGIAASMEIYTPPIRPYQAYTQGFWYAIAAAAFYLLCSTLLLVNMLGYFLGHYPDNFALTASQRTLILQTMVFFIWLGGGAGAFMKIESDAGQSWSFANALYFCDVTVLTVGFGDLYPTSNLGRGIVFPFSVGGIITLALIVSSIYKFMRELGEEKIIMKHTDRIRQRTADRTVTSEEDLRRREHAQHHLIRKRGFRKKGERLTISAPTHLRALRDTVQKPLPKAFKKKSREPPLSLLKEEKDRFHAMRMIQHKSKMYRKWLALVFSTFAFAILWCIGAVVFWQAEGNVQGMTYFQALYLCYVCLLTIGYGDLAPKSPAGRCFFVVWSLIAVPTMTILVSDLGDTVVEQFRRLSDRLADFTVLPRQGIWRAVLERHPRVWGWVQRREEARRVERGFEVGAPEEGSQTLTLPVLEREAERGEEPGHEEVARMIAVAIKTVAADIHLPSPKRYAFEEWVEFARLIRCTANRTGSRAGSDEDEEGLIEWDWIGPHSPLMSGLSESEWLLQRLCESLVRLAKKPKANDDNDHDVDVAS